MIGLVGMAFVFLFSACSDLGFLHEVYLFIYLFSNLDIDIGFCGLFVSLPLQGNDTRMFFFFSVYGFFYFTLICATVLFTSSIFFSLLVRLFC